MINLSEKNMAVLKASVNSDSQPSTELSLICMSNCLENFDEEMDERCDDSFNTNFIPQSSKLNFYITLKFKVSFLGAWIIFNGLIIDLISLQKKKYSAQARIKTVEGRLLLFRVHGIAYLRKIQKTFKIN
jgi:hypothetical protein